MKLSELRPAGYNPRTISDTALAGLEKSIERFGLVQPIVWNQKTKTVVGGHQRIKALENQGETEADVVIVSLPKKEERALNVALNSQAISGEFTKDIDALLDEIKIDVPDIYEDLLLEELRIETTPEEVEEDEVPEPPEEAVTKPGDLWLLGDHRLLCGDSTKAEDVERVMAGERADLLSTDPPYSVSYTGENRPIHGGKESGKDWTFAYREIDIKDFAQFIDCFFKSCLLSISENAPLYIWHAHMQQPLIASAFENHDLLLHQILVWVKPTSIFGHCYYRWKHEPCAFGWRKGHKPKTGHANLETVWEINWEGKNRVVGNEHPTQKPLEIFAIPMRQHTNDGDVVLEPFSGSGSQLIAAEQLNRRCRAIEISPIFVDVAVKRWENLTGKKAKLSKK
jgi:DNA modification methylase